MSHRWWHHNPLSYMSPLYSLITGEGPYSRAFNNASGATATSEATRMMLEELDKAIKIVQQNQEKSQSYLDPYTKNAGQDFDTLRDLVHSGFFSQGAPTSFQAPSFNFDPSQGSASFQTQGFSPLGMPSLPPRPNPPAASSAAAQGPIQIAQAPSSGMGVESLLPNMGQQGFEIMRAPENRPVLDPATLMWRPFGSPMASSPAGMLGNNAPYSNMFQRPSGQPTIPGTTMPGAGLPGQTPPFDPRSLPQYNPFGSRPTIGTVGANPFAALAMMARPQQQSPFQFMGPQSMGGMPTFQNFGRLG